MAKVSCVLVALLVCFLVTDVQTLTECDTLCNSNAGTACSNIFSNVDVKNFNGDKANLFLLCCLGSERTIHYKFNYMKTSLDLEMVKGIVDNISSALTSKKFAVFVRNCSKGGTKLSWGKWLLFDAGSLYCNENPCP
ncbi:uncharacterized protein LOC121372303 [Gigantopelta aegis]|uniref:uncharacterized protein LOC121372303 n=1 Tax=Gigantopelta aegis TaxID=1735272 RepID=UPI001B88ADFA|nr:uncharacterized protein LOC121372303 [Gigantopelta aegis]